MIRPPYGCSNPQRWLDAYQIAAEHRGVHAGVCGCGRPLPCTAAERAKAVMAETMREAVAHAEEEARQRQASVAETQVLPVVPSEPDPADLPVGARFPRQRHHDTGEHAVPEVDPEPVPPRSAAPVGARFPRARRSSRHRA